MLLTFIGAIAVAVLAACVAFILRRTTGIVATWMIPAAAGAGMFGFTIWNDYSWFPRNAEGLPAHVRVVDRFEHRMPLQPWTYLVPTINRFRAVDFDTVRTHPERPEVRGAVVFLVQRFQPTFVSRQVFDCDAGRRADAETGPFDEAGLPLPPQWLGLPDDDPVLRAVCDG